MGLGIGGMGRWSCLPACHVYKEKDPSSPNTISQNLTKTDSPDRRRTLRVDK